MHHPVLDELEPSEVISTMYVNEGHLWMTSPQKGLLRFAIRLTRTAQCEDEPYLDCVGLHRELKTRISRESTSNQDE